ncbi:DMT family transporter [Chloroflexota bacterium]
MNFGIILAISSAMTHGISATFTRKGGIHSGESFSPVIIDVAVGTLLFIIISFFTGEWIKVLSISRQSLILLIVAGVIHFIFGRFLNYSCIRLLGANRATAIFRTQMFYAVFFGVLLLDEPLTVFLLSGVICIAVGALLVSTQRGSEVKKIRSLGIISGLAGSFFWGISSVVLKPAIAEIGSPYAAILVSYTSSFLIMLIFSIFSRHRQKLFDLRKESLIPYLFAAMLNSVGNLFRYSALGYIPASLVVPIMSTSSIFTLLFSFIMNRNVEIFSKKIIAGIMIAILGTFLLSR